MATERVSQIIKGDKAFVKIKKSNSESQSIYLKCYRVEIEKTKEKKDVTQFPAAHREYVMLGQPEINMTFESYEINDYIREAIESVDGDYLFDIDVYKDDEHYKTYSNMILESDSNVLDVSDVEKYTLKFTVGK